MQSSSVLPDLLKSILNVTVENTYFRKHTMFITADQKTNTHCQDKNYLLQLR